jgi:hypothetical protein
MELIELLEKAEQIKLKLATPDLSELELTATSKELEEIMDQIYEIVDNDNNWVSVVKEIEKELNEND